jgi:hypothetical protein
VPAGLTREERLAAALRANLRKRKAQARAREGARKAPAEGGTQPRAAETGPDSAAGAMSPHPEEPTPAPGTRNTP